jgi:hypothetical protein
MQNREVERKDDILAVVRAFLWASWDRQARTHASPHTPFGVAIDRIDRLAWMARSLP